MAMRNIANIEIKTDKGNVLYAVADTLRQTSHAARWVPEVWPF